MDVRLELRKLALKFYGLLPAQLQKGYAIKAEVGRLSVTENGFTFEYKLSVNQKQIEQLLRVIDRQPNNLPPHSFTTRVDGNKVYVQYLEQTK